MGENSGGVKAAPAADGPCLKSNPDETTKVPGGQAKGHRGPPEKSKEHREDDSQLGDAHWLGATLPEGSLDRTDLAGVRIESLIQDAAHVRVAARHLQMVVRERT